MALKVKTEKGTYVVPPEVEAEGGDAVNAWLAAQMKEPKGSKKAQGSGKKKPTPPDGEDASNDDANDPPDGGEEQ